MKIFLSSQDFWYWPTSQLFSIVKHLYEKQFQGEVVIKNNTSTAIFFDHFIKENPRFNVSLVEDFPQDDTINLYLGIYDPFTIFEAKKKNKKAIFLCNLTFLWNDQSLEYYLWIKGDERKDIIKKDTTNHHDFIILAYLLADQVFIRSSDSLDASSKLYKAIKDKLSFIGPIIYPKQHKYSFEKKYHLIQLGGQVNPITSEEFYCLYFQLIAQLFSPLQENKLFIINPQLESLAKKYLKNQTILTTLGQSEYQKLLAESHILYSPFWINTFFEASYYDIPTYILPEQHLWHIKSLIKYFEKNKISEYGTTLYWECPYPLQRKHESDFLSFLQENYKKQIQYPTWAIQKREYKNLMQEYQHSNLINKDLSKLLDLIFKS